MKYLLVVTAFVCLCSCAWAWGSSELSCASCGSECQSACGTRHFRACCFNFQRRRRSDPSKSNPADRERHGMPSLARDGSDYQGGRMVLQELLRLPQVATFIQQLGNRIAAAPSGSPRGGNNNLKRGEQASKRELYAQDLPLATEGAPNHGLALSSLDHTYSAPQKTLDDFLPRQVLSTDPEDDNDEGDEYKEDFMNAYSGDLMSKPLLDLTLLRSSPSSSSPRLRKSRLQRAKSPMAPPSPVKTSFSSSDVSLGINHLLGHVLKSVYPLLGGKHQQGGNSD